MSSLLIKKLKNKKKTEKNLKSRDFLPIMRYLSQKEPEKKYV